MTLAAGVAVVTTVAVGVTVQVFQPANRWTFTAITGLVGLVYGVVGVAVGLVYGVVGVAVGLVLDELDGVYAMLILLVDVLRFQNPLASGSGLPGWVEYLPGHHATAALFDAASTAGVGSSTVLGAPGYATILVGLSGVAFHHTTRVESCGPGSSEDTSWEIFVFCRK